MKLLKEQQQGAVYFVPHCIFMISLFLCLIYVVD